MKGRLAIAGAICGGLAVVGAWALSQVAPKQSGTAAAIALAGAAVLFASLLLLARGQS